MMSKIFLMVFLCIISLYAFAGTNNQNSAIPIFSYADHAKKLADIFDGNVKLVGLENGQKSQAGLITLNAGGRAVFGVSVPLNIMSPTLEIVSSGALKVESVQLGMHDTIELGETILWDETVHENKNELRSRTIPLSDFVNRYVRQRKWQLPHMTTNGLYFITVQPASASHATIKNLSFYGRPLVEIKSFTPQTSCVGKIITNVGTDNLVWAPPAKSREWWAESILPAGSTIDVGKITITICPTILNNKCKSVGISVNRTAGLFHIAHCAGAANQPWMGTYVFVYADGSTQAAFATLRWNCGVFRSEWLPRGQGDYTWWGPPAYSWTSTYRIPDAVNPLAWQSVYVMTLRNPYPDKVVKEIIATVSSQKTELALLGISLTPVGEAVVGLVEPEQAILYPDKPQRISVMRWSAKQLQNGKKPKQVEMAKPDKAEKLGEVELNTVGHFSYASSVFTLSASLMQPGPVRLTCDGVSSSLLGWMPQAKPDDKPNYLSMIAGGAESKAEFERIRRLGYDAVKVHLGWGNNEEPQPGKLDWSAWYPRFDRISIAGLKISIRNHISQGPDWLQKQTKPVESLKNGRVTKRTGFNFDPADPVYRKAVTDYYRAVGKLAAETPEVISINANYGVRFAPADKESLNFGYYQLRSFWKYMEKHFTIKDINARTGRQFNSYQEITPQVVLADKSGFLLTEYARHYLSLGASLQWDIARAIRENSKVQLAFNHPFEPSERAILGTCFEEYLKIGRDMGPGSPFHETSDRYCLSFTKWLLAKQSMNLQYGDEGNQNPPTSEHNVLSYMWMLWMQCWDSLYCQWWNGRPGSQNIAWLKPYFTLIYNAKYMPDQITLAMSFESGYYDSSEIITRGVHATTLGHYGLANTLLGCNLNPKCYIMDAFPELDLNASSLLIDDSSRFLSQQFANRLEKYIRDGGVYIVTPETDKLNEYAFFKRFGITFSKSGVALGEGVKIMYADRIVTPAVAIKAIGNGKLVILNREFGGPFDPVAPKKYYQFFRNLFCSLGRFAPLVESSESGVFVTPYKTRDGSVLVLAINTNPIAKSSEIKLSTKALSANTISDLGAGLFCKMNMEGNYYVVNTHIEALSCTVIEFSSR